MSQSTSVASSEQNVSPPLDLSDVQTNTTANDRVLLNEKMEDFLDLIDGGVLSEDKEVSEKVDRFVKLVDNHINTNSETALEIMGDIVNEVRHYLEVAYKDETDSDKMDALLDWVEDYCDTEEEEKASKALQQVKLPANPEGDILSIFDDADEDDEDDEDEDDEEVHLLVSGIATKRTAKSVSIKGVSSENPSTDADLCVENIFVAHFNESDLLSVVQSEDFSAVSEEDRIKYAVVASWANYNQVVKYIIESLTQPHTYWETLLRTLSVRVQYIENFIEYLSRLTLPDGWVAGASFDPVNKKVSTAMSKLLAPTSWMSDEVVAQLVDNSNGFSVLEKIILESVMDAKPGTREIVTGVLVRALSLHHEQWQTQSHPVFTPHTLYDVWKGLLELKGYTDMDFWMNHYAHNPLQKINNRAIVDLKIEHLMSGTIEGPICGIEKDRAAHNVLEWLQERATAQDKEYENLWWNNQERDIDMSDRQQADYVKHTLSLLKKHADVLSDSSACTQKQLQHPVLDLLGYASQHDWIDKNHILSAFKAPVQWNLYNNPVASGLLKSVQDEFLTCCSNAPQVDAQFIKDTLIQYWIDVDTSDLFRTRTWNTLFGSAQRPLDGPLNAAENTLDAVLQTLSVYDRWEMLCNVTFKKSSLENPNVDEQVRSSFEQLAKRVPPQTLEQLQCHQAEIENLFGNFKSFSLWVDEDGDQRILFTDTDVKAIIPELEKYKKSAEIFAFWEDFFKRNPSGRRRSARAHAALKNMDRLRNAFPHFEKIVDMVESDLALSMMGKGDFFLPPMIMDGPPGTGKTFFFNEMARVSKNDFHIFNMESVTAGPAFTGLDRMWSNTAPGDLFEKVIKVDSTVNPIILLDEIDKCTDRSDYPVAPVLLSLLEPHSAKKFLDRSVPLKLDLSRITWVATSNDLKKVSAPLLSRFRVVDVPSPNLDARVKMSRAIEEYLRRENLWGANFRPVPVETLQALCAPVGSARDLRKNLMHGFAQAARSNRNVVLPHDLPPSEKIPNLSPWNATFEEIPQHLLENK